MEELMSAGERKQRIIANIIHDFGLQPRLNNDRGTGILVSDSIYDACHNFRLFQNTPFEGLAGSGYSDRLAFYGFEKVTESAQARREEGHVG